MGESHASLDATPDGDSLAELLAKAEAMPLDPTLQGEAIPSDKLALWGLDVADEAGRIDLNSASPQVIANVLGWQTRLSEVLAQRATSAQIASPGNLNPDGGVLVVEQGESCGLVLEHNCQWDSGLAFFAWDMFCCSSLASASARLYLK